MSSRCWTRCFQCYRDTSQDWYLDKVFEIFLDMVHQSSIPDQDIKAKSVLVISETAVVYVDPLQRVQFISAMRDMLRVELNEVLSNYEKDYKLSVAHPDNDDFMFQLFYNQVLYTRWKRALEAVTACLAANRLR